MLVEGAPKLREGTLAPADALPNTEGAAGGPDAAAEEAVLKLKGAEEAAEAELPLIAGAPKLIPAADKHFLRLQKTPFGMMKGN